MSAIQLAIEDHFGPFFLSAFQMENELTKGVGGGTGEGVGAEA